MQDGSNSIANALEEQGSCTKPWICFISQHLRRTIHADIYILALSRGFVLFHSIYDEPFMLTYICSTTNLTIYYSRPPTATSGCSVNHWLPSIRTANLWMMSCKSYAGLGVYQYQLETYERMQPTYSGMHSHFAFLPQHACSVATFRCLFRIYRRVCGANDIPVFLFDLPDNRMR